MDHDEIFPMNLNQPDSAELAQVMVDVRGRNRNAIVQSLIENGVPRAEAMRAVDEAISANDRRSRTLARTDVERFRHAASMLRKKDILILERCGSQVSMAAERAAEIAEDMQMAGYAYFTELDLSKCLKNGMLQMSFTVNQALMNEEDDIVEGEIKVAEQVIEAMNRAGLQCTWSGNVQDNLVIHLQWFERWQGSTTEKQNARVTRPIGTRPRI